MCQTAAVHAPARVAGFYDLLLLDVTGHREISAYPTVVVESRRDGSQWVIDRERYETQVDRRYTTSEPGSARVPETVSLPELFRTQDETITEMGELAVRKRVPAGPELSDSPRSSSPTAADN